MVAGISHDIAFGMGHVGCKGIPHDCGMRYAFFSHVVCFCNHIVYFFKPQKTYI